MSKYQDVLNNVKRFYVESDHYDDEDIRLLQELVDKETPKETKTKKGAINCPRCGYVLKLTFLPTTKDVNLTKDKYCYNCGQKLRS